MEKADIAALLQWYVEAGVDETTGNEPVNWFVPAKSPAPAVTIAQAPSKPAPMVGVSQTVQAAKEQAAACNNLSELYDTVGKFEGCGLKKTATHTVFADGNPDSKLMIIGDAPGADEDKAGIPFVGEAGKLLDRMFKAINLDRNHDLYITNIIPWRPPGNRKPTADEISICLPFVKRHIELFQPKLIILLGGISSCSLLETDMGITRLRGKWQAYQLEKDKIPVRPLLHPAYLLRQPKAKKECWQDLLEIKVKYEELSL